MARKNQCQAYGMVMSTPQIRYSKTGEIKKMAVPLLVMLGRRSYNEEQMTGGASSIRNARLATVWVQTTNRQLMPAIRELVPGDMILVKGTVRTAKIKKSFICEVCGEKNSYQSIITTLYPIDLFKMSTFAPKNLSAQGDPQDAFDAMKECAIQDLETHIEFSDSTLLIGAVTEAPQMYQRVTDGEYIMTVELAVLRSYFVPEDDRSITADFPHLKLYGEFAAQHKDRLRKGQLIMIDGALQSRNITRKIPCSFCAAKGVETKCAVDDVVMEVVPYSIEYLKEDITKSSVVGDQGTEQATYQPRSVGSEAEIDLMGMKYADCPTEPDSATVAVLNSLECRD